MSQANGPQHEKLPKLRRGLTHSFTLGDVEGYIITGEYDDGRLGQVFLFISKQGSTLRGIFDCWATAVSLGLQHGVPLESYVEKYVDQKFEPHGFTDDVELKRAKSVGDYIFRRLALDYLDSAALQRLGITPQT